MKSIPHAHAGCTKRQIADTSAAPISDTDILGMALDPFGASISTPDLASQGLMVIADELAVIAALLESPKADVVLLRGTITNVVMSLESRCRALAVLAARTAKERGR